MRVFFQGRDDRIVINDEITVTLLDIDADEVVLAIDAPAWMEIEGNAPDEAGAELEEWGPLLPR